MTKCNLTIFKIPKIPHIGPNSASSDPHRDEDRGKARHLEVNSLPYSRLLSPPIVYLRMVAL